MLLVLVLAFPILYLLRMPLLNLLIPRSVPGIPAHTDSLPVLGDSKRLMGIMNRTGSLSNGFDQACRDLGPVCQVRISFLQRLILVNDLPSSESMLLHHADSLERPKVIRNLFDIVVRKTILTLTSGDTWKHHRRLLGPAMSSKYLKQGSDKVHDAAMGLIQLWEARREKAEGKAWAAQHDLEGVTMDGICGFAFGNSWEISKDAERQVKSMLAVREGPFGEAVFDDTFPPLAESVKYTNDMISEQHLFPRFFHFFRKLTSVEWKTHHKRLDEYLGSKLKEGRDWVTNIGVDEALARAQSTLELMAAREARGDRMSDEEMKNELFLYLAAGTETSSSVLAWGVKYLANHPEVQVKLRAEISRIVPDILTIGANFDDLNEVKTPYLEAVVYETLRLRRLAPGAMRDVTKDIVVLGKVIPKGETVLFLTSPGTEDETTVGFRMDARGNEKVTAREAEQVLQALRPDGAMRKCGYWRAGTAEDFDPERWLKPDGTFDPLAGPSGNPFSMGQRGCFGKNLAMFALRMFIAYLNAAFFFDPTTEAQSSFRATESITRHPQACFVRPVSWEIAEARSG